MNIQKYLSDKKTFVDAGLQKAIQNISQAPTLLRESMQYSLDAGGKRIRPILVLAAAEAVGGSAEAVLPIACALEFIHTFSLIHDDLPAMDNDDLRRGKPTNHKIYGEGKAILSGDGLFSQAFSLLSCRETASKIDPKILLEIICDIAEASGPEGMVGGQVYDLEAEGKTLDPKALEKVHHYKTGRLITVSVTSGAKAALASASELEVLKQYGEKIGLAFQIVDDILNVEGNEIEMGKKAGSDNQKFKATYPKILGLEASKEMAQTLVEKAVALLQAFDPCAEPLCHIARYIVSRNN